MPAAMPGLMPGAMPGAMPGRCAGRPQRYPALPPARPGSLSVMTAAITPPLAASPDQACRLVCDAVSDGDLDAALAHYEADAVIAAERTVRGREEIRGFLADATASRMLFTVAVRRTLLAGDLALVIGEWTSQGTDPAGRPLTSHGRYWSVVRADAGRHWRIAVENIQRSEGRVT
jgi:ketosteroid isomerase-like protein